MTALSFHRCLDGLRSVRAREILDGQPTILVKQGRILEKDLAKQHPNIDGLSMFLRNKDVFSPEDVEVAILKPDGQPATKESQHSFF